ncbi:MAG: hypothetical protein AUI95_00945 [Crenarchaeota archaeon 13_1_40CM_3_52_4]|nr:MAG: hypothetical protein AUI95_00945 [Crenarchaeota archaeon 13_1_40CM_3_52_4]
MPNFFRFTPKNTLRAILLAIFPWLPPYLFEKTDFYFHLTHQPDWYYNLSGNRLLVDMASFAVWGVVVAYLLRPRWGIVQIAFNALLVWVLFYVACPIYGPGGLWQPECYYTGPDGLVGLRLAGIMFCYGALPVLVKAASKGDALIPRIRPALAVFSGIVLTVVMVWYPLGAWFSGVTYLPLFLTFQTVLLTGVPQIAAGVLAARIGRSVKIGSSSGVASLLFISAVFWTPECPGCDRSLLYILVPAWAIFAFVGSVTELGVSSKIRLPKISGGFSNLRMEDVRRVGLALVLTLCLWTLVAREFWDPSVLYASAISPNPGDLTLGQPFYPYVGGYYNSTQYRICCVEIGVSISMANPHALAPDNFLMAGMGVQSPNCCIDGWDFGWRADAFLMPNSSLIVSASSWETCDSNANCGGYMWEHLWYHSQTTLHPQNISTPIYLRMMWEPVIVDGQPRQVVNWYFNTTGTPWTLYGSYLPDPRLGTYFDIGLSGGPASTIPQGSAFLYQFGVASKTPVSGWSASLLYPSFQYKGSWRMMERANIVQGDFSYWKVNYRWGGRPYPGVTARANLLDSTVAPDIVEFSFTGRTLMNFTPLW